MENCLRIGINSDRKFLNLGIGKYSAEWLTNHYGINFNESYWVSGDIGKDDFAVIYNNKYILYRYNFIRNFFLMIFYDIIWYIRFGITYNEFKKLTWIIR
jgi:hypothetical protein